MLQAVPCRREHNSGSSIQDRLAPFLVTSLRVFTLLQPPALHGPGVVCRARHTAPAPAPLQQARRARRHRLLHRLVVRPCACDHTHARSAAASGATFSGTERDPGHDACRPGTRRCCCRLNQRLNTAMRLTARRDRAQQCILDAESASVAVPTSNGCRQGCLNGQQTSGLVLGWKPGAEGAI